MDFREIPLTIRGARTHNLRSVDLDLPRGRLIVLCGVSGSGKSSLAFDTLLVESNRRMAEALLPRGGGALARPDADLLSGLPPAIGLGEPGPAGPRATVGTRSELHELLRALFSAQAVASCPRCGRDLPVSAPEQVVGALLREQDDAQLTLLAPIARGRVGGVAELLSEISRLGFARARVDGQIVRVEEPPHVDARVGHDVDVVVDRVRVAPDRADRLLEAVRAAWLAGRGRMLSLARVDGEDGPARVWADHPWCELDDLTLPSPSPALFSFNTVAGACAACRGLGAIDGQRCSACAGSRLSADARAFRLGGYSLPELLAMPLASLGGWLGARAGVDAIVEEAARRIEGLCALGLGYLPLGRGLDEISDGERRRLELAARTSARLNGVLYVLDEPSAGLAGPNARSILNMLINLRDAGNTVLVVSHDPTLVAAADHVVEFGPGAGAEGGRVLYEGAVAGLLAAESPTGRALSGRLVAPASRRRSGRGRVRVRGASGWNLALDVDFPLGCLVVVTGESGSGKTALLETVGGTLASRLHRAGRAPLPTSSLEAPIQIERIVRLDRAPIGRSARSCVATCAGLWTELRRLLSETREARVRGFGPEFFSFNVRGGRCEACQGSGMSIVSMPLLPDAVTPCEVCQGRRFTRDVLDVRFRGASVHDLLQMQVGAARRLFAAHTGLEGGLRALEQSGLGYLTLGQSASTLSGGEAQRVRLARALGKPGEAATSLYLLDGLSHGLHPMDVDTVLSALDALVELGASVIVADIDARVIGAADHVIALGPGAGPQGGRLMG